MPTLLQYKECRHYSYITSKIINMLPALLVHEECLHYYYIQTADFIMILERALWALASSCGGAACLGGTRVNPRGRPQESGGDSKAI